MNVLEYALKLESDGIRHYQSLADVSPSKELRHLFTLLADAEQIHYDALSARLKGDPAARIESDTLSQAKNVFQRLMEMKEDLDEEALQVDVDGYRHAIRAEEQSITFYLEAAQKEASPQVRQLLEALAQEEKLHLNIIENIYEFVESPKYFLEWREFGNLKDL